MRKSLSFLAAAAVLAAGSAALAQPTPAEQVDMHVGSPVTNGSSTIVRDRTGVHPDGFAGMSTINHAMADNTPTYRQHRRHHRRHRDDNTY